MSGTLAAAVLAVTLTVPVPVPPPNDGNGVAPRQPSVEQQEQETEERVDLNAANATELQEIPGIGPAMASRIIAWRAEHGPFERVEDLLNISGIGVKTLEKLRAYVVVRAESTTRRR
jgi:competence protein ComEA